MRAFSSYLKQAKSELFSNEVCNLAGSTPPTPPFFLEHKFQFALGEMDHAALAAEARQWIAARTGVEFEQVALTPASTQAAVQVLAALTEPGDTLVVEFPAYEPYLAAARFLSLKIRRYERSRDFEADFSRLRKQCRGAKALLISNPHCPTGWMYSRDQIKKLAKLPCHTVIDEVFLPLFAGGLVSQIDFRKTPRLISISSLSKSTGLGQVRFGWVIAEPRLISRINLIGLHLNVDLPLPILPVAIEAFRQWPAINRSLTALADQNRGPVEEFGRQGPEWLSHDFSRGFFGLLHVPKGVRSARVFVAELLKFQIYLRDGGYFEMPKWVRFHLLAPTFGQAWNKIISYY